MSRRRFLPLLLVPACALAQAPVASIAVTLAEDGGPYYEQVIAGAEQGARAGNPQVLFTSVSCKNNAELQMQQIDGFIQSGVELIVIQRAESGDSSPAVQRARKAGITVVAIDADIPGGTDAVVKPDEEQGGALAARFIARRLNGKGKVAIAGGGPKAEALRQRVAGFTEELKTYPGLAVVATEDAGRSPKGTKAVMSSFLRRFPDLDAVFAVNDPVAASCEQAAIADKRAGLFIVGMEGSPTSLASMKDPHGLIAASPGEDPYLLAKAAVKLGIEIRQGREKSGEVVLVPFTELSRANVDGFEGWTR